MEDLRATGIAMAVGAAAVGGLWLARPNGSRTALSVVDQWTPATVVGSNDDAAALFSVRLGGAALEAVEEGQTVELRLVDRQGHSLGLVPTASAPRGLYKLPRGYAVTLSGPRLVALVNGKTVGSVAVRALPEPTKDELTPSPSPPLAFLVAEGRGLRVATRRPIPKDERWIVTIRRTPYRRVDMAFALDETGVRDFRRIAIPYAAQAELAEVDVERFRLVPRSQVVEVPGLRLESRFGGTALVVDRTVRVSTGLGLNLVLPRQDNGPRRPVRHGDHRMGWATLSAHDPRVGEGADRRFGVRFHILSPRPEALGLRELRIGASSLSADAPPQGPLRERQFTVRGRLTRLDPVSIGKARFVVPIRATAPREIATLAAGGLASL